MLLGWIWIMKLVSLSHRLHLRGDTKLARFCFKIIKKKCIKPPHPHQRVFYSARSQSISKVPIVLCSPSMHTLTTATTKKLIIMRSQRESRTQSRLQTRAIESLSLSLVVVIEMPVYYFKSQLVQLLLLLHCWMPRIFAHLAQSGRNATWHSICKWEITCPESSKRGQPSPACWIRCKDGRDSSSLLKRKKISNFFSSFF